MAMASPANASRRLWKRALHGGALERVRVVLVSPQEAGNVGSVCRVATNFEHQICTAGSVYIYGGPLGCISIASATLQHLEVDRVDPQCDFKGVEAHTMAANVTSRSKLGRMHVTCSLSEALTDCSMVDDRRLHSRVAEECCAFLTHSLLVCEFHLRSSSILQGGFWTEVSLSLWRTDFIVDGFLQLVFGREDRGLTNSELMHCTHVCSISLAYGAGSLNLSHAGAVVLSRLYEQVPQQQPQDPSAYLPRRSTNVKSLPGTASVEAVGNLMRRWELVLRACNHITVMLGIPNYKMQERILIHVRRMLLQSGPSLREVGFLHGFLIIVETSASRV